MTETEWLACGEPAPMLECLGGGKASDRKLRLFAAACCHAVMHLMTDRRSYRAGKLAERLADGLACRKAELAAVHNAVRDAERQAEMVNPSGWPDDPFWEDPAGPGGLSSTEKYQDRMRLDRRASVAAVAALAVGEDMDLGVAAEIARGITFDREEDRCVEVTPAAFLRDLFGPLPFKLVTLDPTWLAWNDGTAEKLARGIYEERAFDRLPILHDALLDAGCHNEDILSHCRSAGPHVRGCWVVDLLLGQT
jgi:hypothetical protein